MDRNVLSHHRKTQRSPQSTLVPEGGPSEQAACCVKGKVGEREESPAAARGSRGRRGGDHTEDRGFAGSGVILYGPAVVDTGHGA